jgi:hypothetical protein
MLTYLLFAYLKVRISRSFGENVFLQLVVSLIKRCSSFDNKKSKLLTDILALKKIFAGVLHVLYKDDEIHHICLSAFISGPH